MPLICFLDIENEIKSLRTSVQVSPPSPSLLLPSSRSLCSLSLLDYSHSPLPHLVSQAVSPLALAPES